ncbi:hypothetical protein IJ596_05970, partial [bacterium]|nr:hypothetical protein [bacterium]
GWNSKTQSTQEEVAKLFTQNLQSLDSYQVSVNPFSGIMENSRKALKSGDIDTAGKFRELYTDRISNAIMTFFDLFKGEKPKANLIYRHAGDYEGNELVGENEMKKLYSEIYEKMKKVLGDRLTEAPTLLPEVVTKFKKSHLIEPTGRARRYFPYDYNLEVQSGLIKEVEKWDSMTPAQQREFLRLYSMKGVDINGKVYAIYPAIDVPHENAYVEIAAPTGIQLNFINRPNVPKIFSDIEV